MQISEELLRARLLRHAILVARTSEVIIVQEKLRKRRPRDIAECYARTIRTVVSHISNLKNSRKRLISIDHVEKHRETVDPVQPDPRIHSILNAFGDHDGRTEFGQLFLWGGGSTHSVDPHRFH
ncbi:hypothetical protein [Amycolatopsis sp. DSM 110486]|uniref:hypothetical protein n=1 Tax=Amycolatopsis sp. DSM 110486 TaxID=2865832 RepID=UPI001C699A4E|nr:hypothetical protein [Amycolatopsis sp. DSM 110486]QYN17145.1 hypothetical protein K1T34_30450 [Amycolatopsis sp. DSM 110486]